MQLFYGMDPLCGWCYGIGPALRRVMADHPTLLVTPVLGGLVTGSRVGPYALMEEYIRHASTRLLAVTGRAPSEAFFQMIRRPGVRGCSIPPSVAINTVRQHLPGQVMEFALQLTEVHFKDGADLNDRATYARVLAQMGLQLDMPDLTNAAVAQSEWQVGHALGLQSFPSLWLEQGGAIRPVQVQYDPARLSDSLRGLIRTPV